MFSLLLDVGGRDGVVALIVLVGQRFLLRRAQSCGGCRALSLIKGVCVVGDVVS